MSKIYTQFNTFLFIFASVGAFEIYFKENTLFVLSFHKLIAFSSLSEHLFVLF
jgi:hypothetical protein